MCKKKKKVIISGKKNYSQSTELNINGYYSNSIRSRVDRTELLNMFYFIGKTRKGIFNVLEIFTILTSADNIIDALTISYLDVTATRLSNRVWLELKNTKK